jgi:hypothetical protein
MEIEVVVPDTWSTMRSRRSSGGANRRDRRRPRVRDPVEQSYRIRTGERSDL